MWFPKQDLANGKLVDSTNTDTRRVLAAEALKKYLRVYLNKDLYHLRGITM